MAKKFHFKRRWKPPFLVWQIVILVLATLLLQARGEESEESDAIDVHVVSTPWSLTFSLVDTENYELRNVTCKDKTNVEIESNENHTCENLEPCTTYFVVLTIKHLNDEGQSEKTLDAKTDYTEPSAIITSTIPYAEKIIMTWEAEHGECISKFEIEAKTNDSSTNFKWTLTNEKRDLTIDGLKPCLPYNIQLRTIDNKNEEVSNQTNTTRTEYLEPGNVSLSVVEYDNAQMKVNWDVQSHTTCVEFYFLKWSIVGCDGEQCGGNTNITNPSAKEFVINELQGCESYELQLFVDKVETAKNETKFVSPTQVPGPVAINPHIVKSTSIEILWNAPQLHPNCVDYYFVQISGPMATGAESDSFKIDSTDANIDFLRPCGHYNYTIAPVLKNGTQGSAGTKTFDTLEGVPSAVGNVDVQSQPHSFDISWDPPDFAELCVKHYRYSVSDEKEVFGNITTATKISVDGLLSCLTYSVQIIPVTFSMEDGSVRRTECETQSKAPNAPIVDVVSTYPDRFAISAQDMDQTNKCETIFARITCESKDSDAPIKNAEKYIKGQLQIIYNTDIGPLSPYTEYRCDTALYNIGGWSQNKSFVKRTEAYYPDKPVNITVKANTNTSLAFTWNRPKFPNGNIKLYINYFKRVEAAYFIPSRCDPIASNLESHETGSMEYFFNDLLPYTRYSFQLSAQNEFGISKSTSPQLITTQPWVSDPITNLTAVTNGPFNTSLEYEANVSVTWNSPCKSNGDIEYFLLQFVGDRLDENSHEFNRTIKADTSHDGLMVYTDNDLMPEYKYTVMVSVKTKSVASLSPTTRHEFEAPAGFPQRLEDSERTQISVEPYTNSNPSKTAVVRFPADLLKSSYGEIKYVALLLSQKDCNEDPEMKFEPMNTILEWPKSKRWNDVYVDKKPECIEEYQTTPLRWNPDKPYARSSKEIEFIIGIDDCDVSYKDFCNGPLKPDTEYNLVIRLFTKSGFNDVASVEFKTDALIELTLILVGVSSCLLLAFIIGFIYLWITKRIKWQRESFNGIEDSFGDIIRKKFALYYRELSKPEKIAREFKELTAVALDLSYSASEMGCDKNRYADIFPYDKNRVILDIDADGSDYINASFIDGYRRRKEYIATQGPKPESTMDFWRMILQHNVRVIVMVTQCREGDVVKCHEYYPFNSNGISVHEKKKEQFDLYDRTELSVVHETFGLKQKVMHFYFKKWPDHGCPTDPMHLITFVRKVKAEKIPSYSPIVVHCSAGVGRTGTFIGLDIIMQRLKNESKINIYETVKKLRFQRMKMVQTITQYTFLYTCTYELVKNKTSRDPLKGDNKKKVSFESQPEPIVSGLRNTSLSSGNYSDMSSLNGHPQRSTDRQSYGDQNGMIPITFNGIIREKDSVYNTEV